MAIHKLIANGSFGQMDIEAMSAAYESALVNLGIVNRDDPITELIAKAIINVVATGERDPCPFRKFHPGWIRIVRQNHRTIDSDVCNPARTGNVRRRPFQVAEPA